MLIVEVGRFYSIDHEEVRGSDWWLINGMDGQVYAIEEVRGYGIRFIWWNG